MSRFKCFFDNSLDLKIIVREFQEFITKKIEKSEKNMSFYLAKENATFMNIAGEFGLYPISNAKLRPVNVLKESLKLITFAIEKSKKQICDEHNLDSIEYRKIGMKLVRLFQETPDFGESDLHTFLKNNFPNEDLNNSFSSSSSQIQLLKNLLLMKNDGGEHIYSSIHKAKGLEADAVLIVAKTSNELKKWLTINREERQADKMDSCRIGFVGFTRAKQILCIACLKPIDDNLRHNLSELKIKHLNEETSSNDSGLTSRQLPLIDI